MYHIKEGNGRADCTCNLVDDTSLDIVHKDCTLVAAVVDYFSFKFIDTISRILLTLSLLSSVIKSSFLFPKVIDEVILLSH